MSICPPVSQAMAQHTRHGSWPLCTSRSAAILPVALPSCLLDAVYNRRIYCVVERTSRQRALRTTDWCNAYSFRVAIGGAKSLSRGWRDGVFERSSYVMFMCTVHTMYAARNGMKHRSSITFWYSTASSAKKRCTDNSKKSQRMGCAT